VVVQPARAAKEVNIKKTSKAFAAAIRNGENPPAHVFSIAGAAFRHCSILLKDQSIILLYF
jgi:sugar (pentulose or hexulose) kinase